MLNIGTGEIIVIAVVALLVLGPQRLPELARGIGKFMREFRRQTDEVRGVVEREFYKMDTDLNAPPPVVPQAAPGLVPMADATPQNGQHPGLVPPALEPSAVPAPEAEQLALPMNEPRPPDAIEPAVSQPPPGHPDHDPPSAAADPVEGVEKKAS